MISKDKDKPVWELSDEELEAHFLGLRGEDARLRRENERLREALEFYASMKYDQTIQQWMSPGPDKARNALAEFKELKTRARKP